MSSPRTWFGFSPVVVISVAGLLAAGSLVVLRNRDDVLDRAVTESCARVVTYKRTQEVPPGMPPRHDIFGDYATVARIQIAALERVSPPADRASLHGQLLDDERRILDLTEQGEQIIGPYTQTGDVSGAARSGAMHQAMPVVTSLMAQSKALDAVYEEHFGIKHCAD